MTKIFSPPSIQDKRVSGLNSFIPMLGDSIGMNLTMLLQIEMMSMTFEEATNVLEIGDINHSDKTRHDTIYNTNTGSNLDPGDALPPEACHIVGKCGDLLGSQVGLPGGHDAIPHCLGLFC